MTLFAEIYAEVQKDTDSELLERIEHAKQMKANFQLVIEACHKAQEWRRAQPPAPVGAGEILDHAQFTGVLEGQPVFEFQAMAPPAWLVDAIRQKRIQVIDGTAYADSRILASGDIVASSDFL